MTAFAHASPFKNCNDNIIVFVRCKDEIRSLNKLVDILSSVNMRKIVFV